MQLRERGEFTAAADLLTQTMELAPQWPEGRFALAESLMFAGEHDRAAAEFKSYLDLDPADSMGASAKLVILGARPATAELPHAYVERLFDQYAARFDKALIEDLKYTGPQRIREAIATRFPQRRFGCCLDLGCGTGLMGVAIRDVVDRLEGVDLSAKMLAEAHKKRIYDAVTQDDILGALRQKPSTYDLILAADVLVYVGDLVPIFTLVSSALKKSGVFVFTLQVLAAAGFRLGTDQRFSHNPTYVASLLEKHLAANTITPGSFRREREVDGPGFLVIAETAA